MAGPTPGTLRCRTRLLPAELDWEPPLPELGALGLTLGPPFSQHSPFPLWGGGT